MNGWNKWKDRILQTGFQSNTEVRFTSWLCFLISCPILFCLYNHSSVQIHPNFFTSCCYYIHPATIFVSGSSYRIYCSALISRTFFQIIHVIFFLIFIFTLFYFTILYWFIFWGNILQKGLFTTEYLTTVLVIWIN